MPATSASARGLAGISTPVGSSASEYGRASGGIGSPETYGRRGGGRFAHRSVRSPISRATSSTNGMATNQTTMPSGTGPIWPIPQPPRSGAVLT